VLLAIPALRALRQRWPDDSLILAAQPRIGELLTALGVVDRSCDVEALGLAALFEAEPDGIGSVREWPARCAADWRCASRVVAWIGSREPTFVRRLTALAPGTVVAPSVGTDRRVVWEHLLHTVGATTEDRTLRVPVVVPAPIVDEARHALRREGWDGRMGLLFVHPGAGGREKRWSTAGFAAVLERLAATVPRLAIVVHRGPADSEAVAALSSQLIHQVMLLEEPQLPVLAGALSRATAYLGNDSGVSHLAASLGIPSVVLFSAERVIWRPWAEHLEPQVVSMPTLDEADVARVIGMLVPLLR
jgi:lipopolysaccharide heptosyltransferase III